ncbi:hypothetical protein PR003_g25876 [Phytophthora rubi]|uniref:Uncharacterized protein n=1 Tax=Phytophthora rubi TaxID=129364 RepID=A0A6A4CKE9_9STRA|nr:hypothetical protein PR002_g8424 [Phytophthora rubi]KAE9288144.1 hypothetical protein PR003_g25876 [Phytophthora rubi]
MIIQDKSVPTGDARVSEPIAQTKTEPVGETPISGSTVKAEPPGAARVSEPIVQAKTEPVGETPILGPTVKAEPPGDARVSESIAPTKTESPEDSTAIDQIYFHEGETYQPKTSNRNWPLSRKL